MEPLEVSAEVFAEFERERVGSTPLEFSAEEFRQVFPDYQPEVSDANAQDDEPEGFIDAGLGGLQTTWSSIKAAANTWLGDNESVVANARDQGEKTKDQKQFMSAISANMEEGDEDVLDALGNVASAIWEQPKGAAEEMVAQLPNMGVALGSMWAGAKGGAALGTAFGPAGTAIGLVAGGITGLFAGNVAIETGFKANELAGDGVFTDEERTEAAEKGVVKGGVITAIDAFTLGGSKLVLGAPRRAVEQAVVQTLKDKGVDVASKEAVQKAFTDNQILKEAIVNGGRAFEKATTKGKLAGRGAVAFSGETVGEGAGEFLGTLAAEGEASYTEAMLESLMAAPLSIGEMRVAKNLDSAGKLTQQAQDAGGFDVDSPTSRDLALEALDEGILSDDAVAGVVGDTDAGLSTTPELNPQGDQPLQEWLHDMEDEIEVLTRPEVRPQEVAMFDAYEREQAARQQQPPGLFDDPAQRTAQDFLYDQGAAALQADREAQTATEIDQSTLPVEEQDLTQVLESEEKVEKEIADKVAAQPEPTISDEFKGEFDDIPPIPQPDRQVAEPAISDEFQVEDKPRKPRPEPTVDPDFDPDAPEVIPVEAEAKVEKEITDRVAAQPEPTISDEFVSEDTLKIEQAPAREPELAQEFQGDIEIEGTASTTVEGVESIGQNTNGSIDVTGDKKLIRAALKESGVVSKGVGTKTGIRFPKKHAAVVREALRRKPVAEPKAPTPKVDKELVDAIPEKTVKDSTPSLEVDTRGQASKQPTAETAEVPERVTPPDSENIRQNPQEVTPQTEATDTVPEKNEPEAAPPLETVGENTESAEAGATDPERPEQGELKFKRKPAKPEHKLTEVLTDSTQTEHKSKQLGRIRLSAETEDGEVVTNTARYWLEDIDKRITEMNKLRSCAT